ncbi:DUF6968 family protein [Neorhodopirellula lusitana]|uniref:DUF6968 family protein n=1 Tax=Neorhodopirellula lusitana TaxID=445327 RepID=UPI00384CB5D1
MGEPIATTDVIVVRPSGESIDLCIRVFQPFADAQNATCGVELTGLFDRVHNIHGEDTFQALALALQFVRNILDGEESNGSVIQIADTDGTAPFAWRDCWFSEHRDR